MIKCKCFPDIYIGLYLKKSNYTMSWDINQVKR